MKVMVMIKSVGADEGKVTPTPEVFEAMTAYNERLAKAGILLDGDGLKPSRYGKRVRFSGNERKVIDGPFAETKEIVAGYWVWQVRSMDEALEWVRRMPAPMPGEESEVEIRPFYEAEDFGPEFTDELREREDRLREELQGRRPR